MARISPRFPSPSPPPLSLSDHFPRARVYLSCRRALRTFRNSASPPRLSEPSISRALRIVIFALVAFNWETKIRTRLAGTWELTRRDAGETGGI